MKKKELKLSRFEKAALSGQEETLKKIRLSFNAAALTQIAEAKGSIENIATDIYLREYGFNGIGLFKEVHKNAKGTITNIIFESADTSDGKYKGETLTDEQINFEMQYFGAKLKGLREKTGLKQYEVAEALNIPLSNISMHEGGKSNITLKILIKYAKFYDVDLMCRDFN